MKTLADGAQFLRPARGGGARPQGRARQRSRPAVAGGARALRQRARRQARVEARRARLRAESQREWLYVVRGRDDDGLLLAADYARRAGLYDRAINTAERTRERHDFATALPDAVPRALRGRRAATSPSTRRCCSARAAGVALRAGHRLVGRRGRPHAADAADRALGREAAGAHRLPADARSPTSPPIRSSARSISSTGSTASTACRRSRPLRIMRGRDARRRGATARRSKAPSGSNDPVQRNARLREKGARQRDVLRAARSTSRTSPLSTRLGIVPPRKAADGSDAPATLVQAP